MKPCLHLRGKALHRKADKLFTLYKDMITAPHLEDKKRIEELLKQIHTSLISRFPRNALRYAIQRSLSGFHPSAHINDATYGLKYFLTIQEIMRSLETNSIAVIDRLISLKNRILSYQNPHLILSCDDHSFNHLSNNQFFDLFTDLPKRHFEPWRIDYPLGAVPSQARPIAAHVSYNVKAISTVHFIHPHSAALMVATQLFENKVLLNKVREKGGAYGAGASYSSSIGCFYFHSYRDPHIASTLDAFDLAVETVASGKFNGQDLEEAKLGIIQQLDAPLSPGSRGLSAYSWLRDGKTLLLRQQLRDQILSLTSQELKIAVSEHLLSKISSGVVVCFGNKDLIEKENLTLSKQNRALPLMPI
jgi:Zn-dependent M16 (insulinase) family peptidase